ncbi:tetratricopeptide repeat protein [Congregibacter sp.]|uniref:tetratricopeptide repeat protein n=1 Tax=Congregibacter sp. TaxID=2744308 RepID=UPI003F6BB620
MLDTLYGLVRRSLGVLALSALVTSSSILAETPSSYPYGGVNEKALALYRQGWSEILERGRWAEAERLYRAALATAPDFVIAKSVLARMTDDAKERETLVDEIKRERGGVGAWGELLLDPYVMTLKLISARESGTALRTGFRDDLTNLAIESYRDFTERYPDEWAVRIEYLEWIHAKHGPGEALRAIDAMENANPTYVARLSYFPASFYAELGDFAQARREAEIFLGQLGPGDWPQAHYIRAFIAYEQGDYPAAAESVNEALRLDPQHVIAQRLKVKADRALAEGAQ